MPRRLSVLAAMLFLGIAAFGACEDKGGPPTPTLLPTLTPPAHGLAASVSVDRTAYGPGEPVRMTLVIENVSAETQRLSFRSGQRYDFVVEDSSGRQVWRWSADKFFILVLGEEAIAPGQRLVYREEWDQRDESGDPLPGGTYAVRGFTVGCLAGTDICDIGSAASFKTGGQR